ncbi:MAG: hypothetical protein IKP20_07040 [Candidatus Methanomethylophilaceae archaeon]|nr:hypothetical protein [Candidatus Methanomethylophilaceae archaeon]
MSYWEGQPNECIQVLESIVSGKSIYCNCGRITVLDRDEMEFKLSLGKELECSSCRNQRIGREIDELDSIFSGQQEEGPSLF